MPPIDTSPAPRGGPPAVSVVIPTFNREAFLREAVASVLGQTYADWELIVADDGSTDGTRDYLAGLQDSRVRTLALEHSGSAARVRNAGAAHARGEWIAFLDSDDLWLPDKLDRQVGHLLASPDCAWSCTGFSFIDANGEPTQSRSNAPYTPHSGWIRERLLTFSATATIQSVVVRRALFHNAGGFDEAFPTRDDYDLALRLAALAQICALPQHLVLIREHAARMTGTTPVVTLLRENERVFRKAGAASSTSRMRRICRQQRARMLASIARDESRAGAHASALAAALRAVRLAPALGHAWRALARVTLRTIE